MATKSNKTQHDTEKPDLTGRQINTIPKIVASQTYSEG